MREREAIIVFLLFCSLLTMNTLFGLFTYIHTHTFPSRTHPVFLAAKEKHIKVKEKLKFRQKIIRHFNIIMTQLSLHTMVINFSKVKFVSDIDANGSSVCV